MATPYPIFEWSDRKATDNERKHGVSFDEAQSAFEDPFARFTVDPEHSTNEGRFVLPGFRNRMRLIVISHSYIDERNDVRIISARKATRSEREQYSVFHQ